MHARTTPSRKRKMMLILPSLGGCLFREIYLCDVRNTVLIVRYNTLLEQDDDDGLNSAEQNAFILYDTSVTQRGQQLRVSKGFLVYRSVEMSRGSHLQDRCMADPYGAVERRTYIAFLCST
eukprot:CCRYP_016752-RA/>CCRYP_016752-RA protein AED:0.36 eAED:0.36 QI:30/1/1/1/0/0/2/249/120